MRPETEYPDFLETIYNLVDQAIFMVDVTEDGEFRYAGLNPAHERATGIRSEDIRGKRPEDLEPALPAAAIRQIKSNYRKCLDKGTTHEYEEILPINGRKTHWLTRLSPVKDNNGKIWRLIGSTTDISGKAGELTERIKEINCLHEFSRIAIASGNDTDKLLERTMEILPEAWQYPEITCVRICFRNRTRQSANFRETPWKLLADIQDGGKTAGFIEIGYLEEKAVLDEGPFLKEERRLIDTLAFELGEVLCRQENFQRLLESEERYRRLFENAMDMIHIVDAKGRITHVNPAELRAMGYTLEEVIGHSIMEFIDPEMLQESAEINAGIKKGKAVHRHETILIGKSGRRIRAEISVVPEMKEGKLASACTIMRDVTDLRRVHRELAAANQLLIDKNRELEQIVFVTSHDLRSPLVNIQGFTHELELSLQELNSTLEQIPVPVALKDEIELITGKEIPESLDFIKTGIHKMDNLLKGLLTISRLGRRPIETARINMDQMIREVVKSFIYQIREKKLELLVDKLPDVTGDEDQLNQAFSNLVDNAIKYCDRAKKGVIRISGKEEAGRFIYTVEDNGPGIPVEKHEKIFEIFYKNETGKPGEGLGLTIVRKIVEKHRGQIHVESEPGRGTRFIISLPELII